MKYLLNIQTVFFLLIAINSFGQYGYGNMGGMGSSGYGNGGYSSGRMGGMGTGGMRQNQEKPRETKPEEIASKMMTKLKTELNLDALQEIAINNILVETTKQQQLVLKREISQEDKIKEIETLTEITDAKINQLLDSEQKKKYKALQDETKKSPRSSR